MGLCCATMVEVSMSLVLLQIRDHEVHLYERMLNIENDQKFKMKRGTVKILGLWLAQIFPIYLKIEAVKDCIR